MVDRQENNDIEQFTIMLQPKMSTFYFFHSCTFSCFFSLSDSNVFVFCNNVHECNQYVRFGCRNNTTIM